MKKILFSIFLLITFPVVVNAAGTVYINGPSSVDNGSNATIKIVMNNVAAWNIHATGSGSTLGCSSKYVDVTQNGGNTNKTITLTCKSTGVGSIVFNVSGDITSSDGTKNYVNLSKTISVVKSRKKDSESRLKNLIIEGYDFDFSQDIKEYYIVVKPNTDSIKISAVPISNYASIEGTGTLQLDEDENVFNIICISETGDENKYVLHISKKDENPINITINGKKYIVLKSSKLLQNPTNAKLSTIKINNFEIPAFINESAKLTIVGIKDTDGNVGYATYDGNKYAIYNENKSEIIILIKSKELKGYKKENITINGNQYSAYKMDKNYYIVYGENILTGEDGFYLYNANENTFQMYNHNINKGYKSFNVFILIVIISTLFILFLALYIYKFKKVWKKKNK